VLQSGASAFEGSDSKVVAKGFVKFKRVNMLICPEKSTRCELLAKFQQAFAALLEAFDYAVDLGDDRWDFAVRIRDLRDARLNESDLRWLVRKGFVQHAREATLQGENGRHFQPTGNMTFVRRSCFVLTDLGVEQARSLNNMLSSEAALKQLEIRSELESAVELAIGRASDCVLENTATYIHWDAEHRKLDVRGQVVKRFKWQAPNQEIVLSAFQEEGWPLRIDDPLPPQPEQDSKRRLSDTIKCLNRKQINSLIHFHGDGTGEGVVWELVGR